ncbi:MAG TPA: SUMF1/EgtB/PvdO family nonheme iron enzyme [Acidobacteriota bacterium]|nr:SUMF1/EgtB/PvdO family nonheme iron enzyme [Acidobacteriota bacterium]
MLRKASSVFALLALGLALAACGKKEEATPTTQAPAVPEKPAVVPGEMVLIPAGEFTFGTNDKDFQNANPQQKVNLPAFWIDKYEVTNAEFLDFAIKDSYSGEGAKEGKDWRTFFTPDKAHCPVIYITWNDASAYCKAQGKRLPTEVEWEKAARGTDGRRFPWGDKWEPNKSNTYEAGLRNTADIGKFDDVSPYGVHDMLGNVQEWTGSWYESYKGNTFKDENFGKRWRVLRGASNYHYGARFGLWARTAYVPNYLSGFGCRCAKDATPEEAAKGAAATK